MDEFIYNAYDKYFKILSKLGYVKNSDANKLLILDFYYDMLYNDYRGLVSSEDYMLIEKAFNCLYGTSCLTPYPDYLKMAKLSLGEATEMAQRIKNLEDTNVLKMMPDSQETIDDPESDIIFIEENS